MIIFPVVDVYEIHCDCHANYRDDLEIYDSDPSGENIIYPLPKKIIKSIRYNDDTSTGDCEACHKIPWGFKIKEKDE